MLQGARGRYAAVRLRLLRVKAWVYAGAVLGLLTLSVAQGEVLSHATPGSTAAFVAAMAVLAAFVVRGRDRTLTHGIVGVTGLVFELPTFGDVTRAVLITAVAVPLVAWLADGDEWAEQPELTTPAVAKSGS